MQLTIKEISKENLKLSSTYIRAEFQIMFNTIGSQESKLDCKQINSKPNSYK